jgi:hypothetical protein
LGGSPKKQLEANGLSFLVELGGCVNSTFVLSPAEVALPDICQASDADQTVAVFMNPSASAYGKSGRSNLEKQN